MMKVFFISSLVCLLVAPDGLLAVLPTCTSEVQCPTNSTCPVDSTPCVCDDGFHESGDTCLQDFVPGSTCMTQGDATECVGNATCTNVAAQGESETLQCTCDTGYHVMTSGASSCVADIALGEACTVSGSDDECAGDGATCTEVSPSLVCACKEGFHQLAGDPPVCEADIEPGGTCTNQDEQEECVSKATCVNVALPGVPEPLLKCFCNEGFHSKTVNESTMCEADITPGQPCMQPNGASECVDHATCVNVRIEPVGEAVELRCMCDDNFHEETDEAGIKDCVADACIHTRDSCNATGMSTCEEVDAYIRCMLTGVCNPTDSEELDLFKDALDNAGQNIPADCDFTNNATCTDQVTKCLYSELVTETNCSTVEALKTCLSEANSSCGAAEDATVYALADAYMMRDWDFFSCGCVKAVDDCAAPQLSIYEAASDTATKCGAVQGLFSCALTTECDFSKAIDQRTVSHIWTEALTLSGQSGCRDHLTDPATCKLQLTKCALLYADALTAAAENKSMLCRASEDFGACLAEETNLCSDSDDDEAMKRIFRYQYTSGSSTCTCINHLNQCRDAAGVVPSDPAVACPKMVTYSQCVLGAQCSLGNEEDLQQLLGAHNWYKAHIQSQNCRITSNHQTCGQDVSVCADNFITNMSAPSISGAQMCNAVRDAMLCVYAANCSRSADDYHALVSESLEAGKHRLMSLGCSEPECNNTQADLVMCKDVFDQEFEAGTDNNAKCDAKNKMVTCLRGFTCNPYLTNTVHAKYNALKDVQVTGCDMLKLEEEDGGTGDAPTLHATLLALLLSLAGGLVAVRM